MLTAVGGDAHLQGRGEGEQSWGCGVVSVPCLPWAAGLAGSPVSASRKSSLEWHGTATRPGDGETIPRTYQSITHTSHSYHPPCGCRHTRRPSWLQPPSPTTHAAEGGQCHGLDHPKLLHWQQALRVAQGRAQLQHGGVGGHRRRGVVGHPLENDSGGDGDAATGCGRGCGGGCGCPCPCRPFAGGCCRGEEAPEEGARILLHVGDADAGGPRGACTARTARGAQAA